MPIDKERHLGPIDAKDPAFAPDREVTPDLPGDEAPEGLMDMVLDFMAPETPEERANRFYQEAEEEEMKRERMTKMMGKLRERRLLRQEQQIEAQQERPSGSPNAFSLERAVNDILQRRNEALTEAGG